MKRTTIAGLIAVVLIVSVLIFSGCVEEKAPSEEVITGFVSQTPTEIREEKVGGKYNTSILTVHKEYKNMNSTWQQIEYTKDNKTIRDDFVSDIRNALDWIKLNTPEDAVIVSWWDYGHSIEGYTGREVVIDAVSKEMLYSVAAYKYMSPEQQKEFEAKCVPNERIMDVAKILITDEPQAAIEIMEKYDATFIFVHKSDATKSHVFFTALGEDPIDPGMEEFGKTIIGKSVRDAEIDGFELVYSDEIANVYELI